MRTQISQEMLAEVKEAFALFDSNKTGIIDAQELRLCLRALGFDLSRQEIQQILVQYNAQESGEINKDQFIEIASEKILNRDPIEEIRKAFKLFDQDGTGKISLQNLRQVARDLGENVSDDELRAMIQEFDRSGEGQINEDDFVEVMKSCGAFIEQKFQKYKQYYHNYIQYYIQYLYSKSLHIIFKIVILTHLTQQVNYQPKTFKFTGSWWSKEEKPIDLPVASEVVNPGQIRKILDSTKNTSRQEISDIIDKAYDHALLKNVNPCELKGEYIQGLPLEDIGKLLNYDFENDKELEQKLYDTAFAIKNKIYGNRIVLFAPIYTSNLCSNSCSYCGYRCANDELERQTVSDDELRQEVKYLTDNGYKRTLMLCGEHPRYTFDQFLHQVNVAAENPDIRRINIEIPPLSYSDLRRAKTEGKKIGTEICFQETYDPVEYRKYHKAGPKSNYQNRLTLMHRSLKAGLDDVGLGVLYGLADYKFDTLAMIQHANCLNDTFGVGPHTVSMPRIQPALGAETSLNIPHPVNDEQFKQIVAILRLSIPYTGMILSTRENPQLRKELLRIGISQLSAGSQTNPGGYTRRSHHEGSQTTEQFQLSDERTLDEITYDLLKDGYQPSHCTSCYGVGRTGQTFMKWAKTGEIQDYCLPNGLLTLQEYLTDFASPKTKQLGEQVIEKQIDQIKDEKRRKETKKRLNQIKYSNTRGKLF